MKKIEIDATASTATIGPGVTSGELLAAAEPHGLAYPSGQVSSVGVMGYTLGGGYGWLGRKVGAACSTILSAVVVLADGSVVTASATENPSLFWAIRGGGGNFGVIVSMTLGLIPLGDVLGGLMYYHIEDAPAVLRFYREWSASLGEDTSTYLRLMSVPPKPNLLLHLRSTKACVIGICHTDLATADVLHEQIRSFKEPAFDDLKRRPYSEMASFDEASNQENASTFSHMECLRELSDDVMDQLVDIAATCLPPLVLLELQQLGGALTRQAGDEMAYTAPKAPFYFKVISPTLNTTLEGTGADHEGSGPCSRPGLHQRDLLQLDARRPADKGSGGFRRREIQPITKAEASVRPIKSLSPQSQHSAFRGRDFFVAKSLHLMWRSLSAHECLKRNTKSGGILNEGIGYWSCGEERSGCCQGGFIRRP